MNAIAQPQSKATLAHRLGRMGRRRFLLACGTASTALYVAMDIAASMLYDGYSPRTQTISELSAVGAPTRPLWIPLGVVYSTLVIAGAFGIWASAGRTFGGRIVSACVAAVGVIGLVAWPFAPMHQRDVLAAGGATLSDTLHIILGAVDTILFVVAIGIGASLRGKRFRLYSAATLLAVLVSGAFTAVDAPKVADNEPTPWIGITERIAVFGSMIWISMLCMAFLRDAANRHGA